MNSLKHGVWLVFLIASEATASPFWCNGDERFIDHPLDYDAIAEQLNQTASLPELYQDIHERFIAHVTDIGMQFEPNVGIAMGMFDDLLNPASHAFLKHTHFRWRDVQQHGFDPLDCTSVATEVQMQQPALAAVYSALETTNLAGRQANLTAIKKDTALIRKNWKDTNSWLLEDGLAQWPWEMWLNEKWLNTDPGSPTPKQQYLFLRPSLGLNLSYPRAEDADLSPTGALEVIGKIWYRDSYKKHWGIALLTDIDTDNGAGIGISLRWNGYWVGWVDHADDRPASMYVGLDLHNLLQSNEQRRDLANEFIDELSPSVKGLRLGIE